MMRDIPPTSDLEWVELSTHAGDRWHQHMDESPGHGPLIAWNISPRLPSGHGLYCDEARYHAPTKNVLLVATDGPDEPRTIVTVIDGPTAKAPTRDAIKQLKNQVEIEKAPA